MIGGRGNTIASAGAFALPFATILYIGLTGGGYDLLVWGEVGLVAWWAILLAAAVGLLPARRLSTPAWAALGALTLFAVWTALAIGWGESAERAAAELARVTTYLGVFLLALAIARAGRGRQLLGGVTAAIAILGLLALLSRLHPSWFPADEAAPFLAERNRLDYPLGYFNGLAALLAMGIVLVLGTAAGARGAAVRALAAAAVPALVLAMYFTLSRGGAVAAVVGAGALLALATNRLRLLATLLATGAGAALLVLAAGGRPALEAGANTAQARSQGDEMLLLTLVVCAVVAGVQVAVGRLARERPAAPAWLGARRRAAIAAGASVVALSLFVVLGGAGRASDAWEEFKTPDIAAAGAQDSRRFRSVSGQGRYQFWQSALEAARTEPLTGIGPGSFEYWWAREGSFARFVRDAHSLYLEALAELGVLGLLLIAALVVLILVGGAARALRARHERALIATATAACTAFALSASIEWVWEIALLPIAFFLLAGVALASEAPGGDAAPRPSGRARLAVGALALLALLAIVPPLGATSAVRASEEAVAAGRFEEALGEARAAKRLQPYAASPQLQLALIEERRGRLGQAAAAAADATDAEPTNWRTWAILARTEARRGRAEAATRAFVEARSLNPRSFLFTE